MNAPHAIRINSCVRRTSRDTVNTSLATAATNYELWGVVTRYLLYFSKRFFFPQALKIEEAILFKKKKKNLFSSECNN